MFHAYVSPNVSPLMFHPYVSPHFHDSRMRRTVLKDLEIIEANENKRKLSGFHYFVLKFRIVCFSVFLIN